MDLWTEQFKHLLNAATASRRFALSIVEASESLEIDLGPIRFDEVLQAVLKLKNGKANGRDDISAEMLRSHNRVAVARGHCQQVLYQRKSSTRQEVSRSCPTKQNTKEKDLIVGTIVEFHSRSQEKCMHQSS